MKFARHETFAFREGWLTKVFRKIEDEQMRDVFVRDDAMEQLGIGSNMVKSLRYWMQATGLTYEVRREGQQLTGFGEVIYQYDHYLEQIDSLWLVHYHLACNYEWATSWFWFFNNFAYREFDEVMFTQELALWTEEMGWEVAKGSLKRDFDCILSMYANAEGKHTDPEEHLGCPLQELKLITPSEGQAKMYRFTKRNLDAISPEIIFYMILDFMEKNNLERYIAIESLLTAPCSIGRVLALNFAEVVYILEKLQAQGWLQMIKTAGLNQVVINDAVLALEYLNTYYENNNVQR